MTRGLRWLAAALLPVLVAGCDWHFPGKPIKTVEPVAGSRAEFDRIYFVNCLGCHGPEGRNGPARPMNDPLYLAVIPDKVFEQVTRHRQALVSWRRQAKASQQIRQRELSPSPPPRQ